MNLKQKSDFNCKLLVTVLTLLLYCCGQSIAKEIKDKIPENTTVLKETISYSTGPPVGPLTLEEAVNFALKNYPSIRVSEGKILAAKAGVGLAKTAYLPQSELFWQTNRGTGNNISGIFFPQYGITPLSGQVRNTPNFSTAWGSLDGGILSWDFVDFGLKKSKVNLAKSDLNKALSGSKLTEFEVQSKVSDIFFKLLAGEEAVKAFEASVERAKTFADSVNVLAKSGLRPGADASRAAAELAAASTELVKAKEQEDTTRAYFAQLLGAAGRLVTIKTDRFLDLPENINLPKLPLDLHPIVELQKSNIESVKAREKVLFHSYFPKLNLLGAFNGRGSGFNQTVHLEHGANGLYPTRLNLAAAVTTNLPLLEWPSIRANLMIEKANEQTEVAKYDEIIQEITGKLSQAKVIFESAQEIVKEASIQLDAAQISELQARERFKAGLGTVIEVADAQRLLTKSEIENILAKIDIWQALLNISIAEGDLKPFLTLAKSGAIK